MRAIQVASLRGHGPLPLYASVLEFTRPGRGQAVNRIKSGRSTNGVRPGVPGDTYLHSPLRRSRPFQRLQTRKGRNRFCLLHGRPRTAFGFFKDRFCASSEQGLEMCSGSGFLGHRKGFTIARRPALVSTFGDHPAFCNFAELAQVLGRSGPKAAGVPRRRSPF